MADHTTLPSRGLRLRPIGKSSECLRMTAGVKSGKAQNEHMFSGLPPKADLPPDLRTTPAASLLRTPPSRPRASAGSVAPASRPSLCQPRIPKDCQECSASAIRKRIGPALAIVDEESLDGHGLHCVRGDANSSMAHAGCGAEQDHALLCGERRRLHDT